MARLLSPCIAPHESQVPEAKSQAALAADIESWCCLCSQPWAEYRGQFKCAGSLPPPTGKCAVPVIVCKACQPAAAANPSALRCPLCQEGYIAPQSLPEMVVHPEKKKRLIGGQAKTVAPAKGAKRERPLSAPASRLFVGGMPYVTDATSVRATLAAAAAAGGADGADTPLVPASAPVDWVRDRKSGLFYGSAFVQMGSIEAAEAAVKASQSSAGVKLGKRKLRLNFAPVKDGESWPSEGFEQRERPPVA